MTPEAILAAIVAVSQAIKAGLDLALAQWQSMTPKQKETEIDRRQTLTEPGYQLLKSLNEEWQKTLAAHHAGGTP